MSQITLGTGWPQTGPSLANEVELLHYSAQMEGSNMFASLVPRRLLSRVLAILWSAICLLILLHSLFRIGSSVRAISDALELQMYTMFAMSYPSGGWIYSAMSNLPDGWWPYSDSDARSILLLWLGQLVEAKAYTQCDDPPKPSANLKNPRSSLPSQRRSTGGI